MTEEDLTRLAEGYRAFEQETAESSPVYARLSAAVAEDRDVLAFLAELPTGKGHPTLLFAGLRFLDGVPADGAELHDRVVSDADRLRAPCWPGPPQTNEPARCAALLPAFAAIDGPLALVEVGASAGLCLLHTAVLPYVDSARRAEFVDRVRGLPVRWVAQESQGMVPGTGEPFPGDWGPYFVLSLDGRPLAHTAHHGGRLDRLPEAG